MTDDEILDALRTRIAQGRPTDSAGSGSAAPPVSAKLIVESERRLGFALPPLLRRVYGEVANGGVGPFHGIQGLGAEGDMVEIHVESQSARHEPAEPEEPPAPPAGVLFFCDFGCAQWTLVDCRRQGGQMWWWEEGDRWKLDLSLREWLCAWLEGRLDTVMDSPVLRLADESWSRS
jgi:hypothetical protein